MAPSVDPAIIQALGLDPAQTSMAPHGHAGFASSFRLSTVVAGQPTEYFVKTGSGKDAEVMFRGEHASLKAIHETVPSLCPQAHAHGPLSASNGFFLATDFLHLQPAAPAGSGLSLAAKLGRLHTTPARAPDGNGPSVFGFPVPTCCGKTVQDNSWRSSWADFYAHNRLRAILRACIESNGPDDELSKTVEAVADRVADRLLGEQTLGKILPVVIHGDLWSGNHGRGQIGGQPGAEEVVFDPSAVYGHSEYELGIMQMFGGFDGQFWAEYHQLVPKAQPEAEWADRIKLYELYHHLNHLAIFGRGYRSGAMSIMKALIAKYGD